MTISNNKVNGKEIPLKEDALFLVTGGSALPFRESGDIDLLCFADALPVANGERREFIREQYKNGFDIKTVDDCPVLTNVLNTYSLHTAYFCPTILYLLKLGHIHINRRGKQWFRDITDLHILKNIVCAERGEDSSQQTLYSFLNLEELKLLTDLFHRNNQVHNPHQMNLKVSKEVFFDDGVVKHIEHDLLHEFFAHEERPMYKKCQKDDNTVFCHEDLFNSLTSDQKDQMVLEEMYVITAERCIIPDIVAHPHYYPEQGRHKPASKRHFLMAFTLVCTNLSSGYFRKYAINNYFNIKSKIDTARFMDILDDKIVPLLLRGKYE